MRRGRKNHNSELIEWLGIRPIAFNPVLAQIGGGAAEGLFLCQLLYWWKKGADENWIYKTVREFESETCLTRREQERAIKRWAELGVIEVQLRGIPRKRYFKIDTHRLGAVASRFMQKIENKSATSDELVRQSRPSITESSKRENHIKDFSEEIKEKKMLENQRAALTDRLTLPDGRYRNKSHYRVNSK